MSSYFILFIGYRNTRAGPWRYTWVTLHSLGFGCEGKENTYIVEYIVENTNTGVVNGLKRHYRLHIYLNTHIMCSKGPLKELFTGTLGTTVIWTRLTLRNEALLWQEWIRDQATKQSRHHGGQAAPKQTKQHLTDNTARHQKHTDCGSEDRSKSLWDLAVDVWATWVITESENLCCSPG